MYMYLIDITLSILNLQHSSVFVQLFIPKVRNLLHKLIQQYSLLNQKVNQVLPALSRFPSSNM